MKNLKKFNWNRVFALLIILVVAACATETIGPKLGDKSKFQSPTLTSAATTDAKVFTVDMAATDYEKFTWKKTDYGGPELSTDYVLQIDTSASFTHPKQLVKTSADNAIISVEKFNDAVLSFGVGGFEEATVRLRLMSTINGFAVDTLYSTNSIERTVTTYVASSCGTYCTIGIIGDGTPGGWDVDTDMHLADPTRADKHTWAITIYLTQANAKFRASDDWANNWGAVGFPTGTGTSNGANIPVSAAGYYNVTFNDETGAYTFTALAGTTYNPVAMIGSGTPGGWDNDTNMDQDGTDPHVWTATIDLVDGEVKFRANHAWDTNWGNTTFPSGYGVGNGPNIPVTANTYFVWFNDVSGEYHFGAAATSTPFAKVSLIGPGAADWDTDVDLTKNPGNAFVHSKQVTMNDGETKFRANHDWGTNWGGAQFPQGVGLGNGPNIPAKAGSYFVSMNSLTGEYYFLK